LLAWLDEHGSAEGNESDPVAGGAPPASPRSKDAADRMFRLITTVKRGSGSNFPAVWVPYDTLDDARAAAAILLREERISHVMIVRDSLEHEFVEWCSR
jgi:hypothetical protein